MAALVNPAMVTLADWDGNLYRIPRALLEHYRLPVPVIRLAPSNGHDAPYPHQPLA